LRFVLYLLTILFFISCSTPFNIFLNEGDNVNERNEKLMKDDFKLEEDVFKKFQENPTKVQTQDAVEVIKKEQVPPVRKAIRPKPTTRKFIKKTPKKKIEHKNNSKTAQILVVNETKKEVLEKTDLFPDDYPAKLKKLNEKTAVFWNTFTPALNEGEETVLNIEYMGVSTGKITIKTLADTRLGDTDVYHLHARVKTAKFYSYLYEVDDVCDSYVRKQDFTPLKFSLIQRQTSQDVDDLQLFDLKKLKTYTFYKRVTKKKTKKKKKVEFIPQFFQDPISVLYFIRGLPMKKAMLYSIPIVNHGKVEMLTAQYEKTELIETKLGKKRAYKVKVNTQHEGETLKGGNMTFWFSADEKRIFLRFKAKIKIGSVSGEVDSHKE
jgi:hypothetical protein